MSKHGVLSVANQVKKINSLSGQQFGFQQQMIDVAENLYLITTDRCDIHAGGLFLDDLKKYHIARDQKLQRDRAAACVRADTQDASEGEDSGGSSYVNLSGSSNSRFSTDANNGNNPPPEMISLLDDDDDKEVGINE